MIGRRALLWAPLLALALADPAAAGIAGAVLHEPIPPDAREDLAMHVALDADLPAALLTRSGVVSAPDPRAPTSSSDSAYGADDPATFQPDRDTRKPEVTAYDEPFTPSTAPFKRLEAFDAVRESYQLYVRDPHLTPLPAGGPAGADDEAFYADLVVDVRSGHDVRIPTVGPGARIVRGRLGEEASDVPFRVLHDGADNAGFCRRPPRGGPVAAAARARDRGSRARPSGGQIGDPAWSDLPLVPPLPDNVARDAAQVRAVIGVSRAQRPREAIGRLVHYFRGFADSDEPPHGKSSVYLDLALSKKGVCRHRAFAFLVTAQSLGIPTRFVSNETHAWVEVHDGSAWRRIDLGGAGHMVNPASNAVPERAVFQPPADAFAWPQNANRGDDMVADARARAAAAAPGNGSAAGSGGSSAGDAPSAAAAPSAAPSSDAPSRTAPAATADKNDARPSSTVTLAVADGDAHRGTPVHVQGDVHAEGEACAHVTVEVWLRDRQTQRQSLLGTLATDDEGHYSGGLVVPATTPVGDYDVVAHTPGDARCGGG